MSENNGRKYKVFLGQPNTNNIMACCIVGVSHATRKHELIFAPSTFGDVPHNFNLLWTTALNMPDSSGITHFALLHSDVKTSPGWLDVLIEEMDRVDADVMSAVVAIKDGRGLTTTGIRHFGLWGSRRYTVKELNALPETFSIEDTDEPTEILAINTGCWVCRFPARHGPGHWIEKFPGFQNKHRITCREGRFEPEFDSEDWMFSEWLASQRLRVFATRKVKTAHLGIFEFENFGNWGFQTDEWRPIYPAVIDPPLHMSHETAEDRQIPAAVDTPETADTGAI